MTSTVKIFPKTAIPTSNLPPTALGVSEAHIIIPRIPGATSAGLVWSQIGALPDDSMGQSLSPLQLHC